MQGAETLGDALPKEQARVRALLAVYHGLGPTGAFGAAMLEKALRQADAANISGDVVALIKSYEELRQCQ